MPQPIHRAARQRLRLNTHRAHHLTAAQPLPGAGFIFHLQIQANGESASTGFSAGSSRCQTVGVDRQRQQQRRIDAGVVAQPLFFQQLHLMQQRQQLLPLFGRARRHGTNQQRLAEQVFQLFDALGYRRLRDTEF